MPSPKRSVRPARRSSTPSRSIRLSDLQRLSFADSPRLPQRVWIEEQLCEWTGLGWIVIDPAEADGTEPVVIDD